MTKPSDLLKLEILAVLMTVQFSELWTNTQKNVFTTLDFGHCIWELRDNNFSAYQTTTPWIYVPLPKTCTILVRHVATLQNKLSLANIVYIEVFYEPQVQCPERREYNSTFKRETSPYPITFP